MTQEQRQNIDHLLKELDTLVVHNKTFKDKVINTIGKKLSLAEYQEMTQFLTRAYMEAPDNNYMKVDEKLHSLIDLLDL